MPVDLLASSPALWAAAIFFARVLDVSLGTLRTILVFRGHQSLAAAFGFFETLLWVLASAKVLSNLSDWHLAVAYAAGFATGNVVGIRLESLLGVGSELIRVISRAPDAHLAEALREMGHRVTALTAHAGRGVPVEVVLVVERRRRVRTLLEHILQIDPEAVWTINDVRPSPDAVPHQDPAVALWLRRILRR